MTCWSRRYCSACSRWLVAWQVRQSQVSKLSSSWVSVWCAPCCSRCVSEKDPKCTWDMIYGLTDVNQHSNWAGNGRGSSRRGSGCKDRLYKQTSICCSHVTGWPNDRRLPFSYVMNFIYYYKLYKPFYYQHSPACHFKQLASASNQMAIAIFICSDY